MKEINFQSEFKLFERQAGGETNTPFRFTYETFGAKYAVSFDGRNYTNCRREPDGTLVVIFENHGLRLGPLMVRREYFLTDQDFKDGICNLVSVESAGICLVSGRTDTNDVKVIVPPHYQQGPKGDPLTWDDMTPAQQDALKQKAADSVLEKQLIANDITNITDILN